jgi:hypothetical protein
MPKLFGSKNGMYGKKHPNEIRAAISNARRNKKWIYDPLTQTQKSVDFSEVSGYISRGWKLGRLKYQKDPDFLLSF